MPDPIPVPIQTRALVLPTPQVLQSDVQTASPPATNPSTRTSEKNAPNLPHNNRFPSAQNPRRGHVIQFGEDTAHYLVAPESGRFNRPWLAVPGDRSFVWPGGTEGFDVTVNPQLGIHKFLGSNQIEIDVMHVGLERIQMSGVFPGATSTYNAEFLKDIVTRPTPRPGKILFIPYVLAKFQYVVVEEYSFSHPEGDRFHDVSYSITFQKVGVGKKTEEALLLTVQSAGKPTNASNRGVAANTFSVTSRVNTLRRVAEEVYGNQDLWGKIAIQNADWFRERHIGMAMAVDFKLPVGLDLHYE